MNCSRQTYFRCICELILVDDGGGHEDNQNLFFVGHEDDGRGLVGGEVPFKVILRPEDPLGVDRGGWLGYGVSNHSFLSKKGVNDEMMGQFSLLEKDKASRSVVTAWLIAEKNKK